MTDPQSGQGPGFWIPALVWLPAGLVVVTLFRMTTVFGGMSAQMGQQMVFAIPAMLVGLAVTAPCGLPLALACRRIWRTGARGAAWTAFAILGSLTAVATLFAGLLGPIAIAIYAAVLSVPAWILYAILRRRPSR